MPTKLQYKPLDLERKEIRLLQFDTADSLHEPIRAQLVHAPLNDELIYFALSYTWGSSERARSIHLSGHEFPVTENLYQALHSFRNSRSDLKVKPNERYWYIWIDAISINQEDVAERNYEVTRMTEIYHSTAHVYIWLGVASQDSALAVEHLRGLAEHATWDENVTILQRIVKVFNGCLLRVVVLFSACFYTLWKMPVPQVFILSFGILRFNLGHGVKELGFLRFVLLFCFRLTTIVLAIKAIWLVAATYWTNVSKLADQLSRKPKVEVVRALQSFFQRPWFYRVWIIQEVAMAKGATIFCGDDVITWDTFCLACRQIQQVVDRTSERSLYLDTHYRNATGLQLYSRATPLKVWRGHAGSPQRDLWSLLIQYAFFGATNQRDKIYSLVGLAKDCDFAELNTSSLSPPRPDYNKPVPQVYAEWMRFMILNTNSLALLELCDGICEMPDLPSWVPDFSQRLARERQEARTDVIAKFPHIPIADFSSDLQTLTAHGFTVGHLDGDMRSWSTTTAMVQHRLGGKNSSTTGPVDMSFLLKIIQPFLQIFLRVFLAPVIWKLVKMIIPIIWKLARKLLNWYMQHLSQGQDTDDLFSRKLHAEVDAWTRGCEQYVADWHIVDLPDRSPPLALENTLHDESPDISNLSTKSLGWIPKPDRLLKPSRCYTTAHDAQQGDAICLLVGSRQPVLLRKREDHFQFVGMLMPWNIFTYVLWNEYEEGYTSGRLQMETFELK